MDTTSTVVLTGVGAEGQVGEVVAAAFADLGASLILIDRTAHTAESRAEAIVAKGGVARGYACDLTDPDDLTALIDRVRRDHGDRVHALVHMAGGFVGGGLADTSPEIWNRLIAINLTTAYMTTRAFLPLVRAARGSIVLFASQAALPGATGMNMASYAVAKSGVAALMRATAAEEREHGVRVNAVAPISIRTAANVASMGSDARYIEREQVAAAVTFLCSSAASAITGELLPLS